MVERYNEIDAEFEGIQRMMTEQAEVELIQARLVELEAKQTGMKKTLQGRIDQVS